MKPFEIVVRLEDGARELVGLLAMDEPAANGRYRAEFRYDPSWLKSPRGFTLDPESVPLSRGTFAGLNLDPPLSVFNDALPDRWGRALLLHDLPLSHRTDWLLVRLRGRNGLGAIEFVEPGNHAGQPMVTQDLLALATLLDAAEKFEAGARIAEPQLRRLLAAGTTAGGARPKATVFDDATAWIAKFPSKVLDGRFDVPGLEKAAMDCARTAGLQVPDTRLVSVGSKRVLLVKRFDVTPSGGRHHMISLSTLCKERLDYRVSSYDDLADAVRKHSAHPADDLVALFKQVIFNGLIGNTDDHLKNFLMLRIGGGYRLSPAFDLLPDVQGNQEHVLSFGLQRYIESRRTVFDLARRWGIADSVGILGRVLNALSRFREFAEIAGVPAANIVEIEKDLEKRAGEVSE